jgi:hypothetical protein
MRRDFRVHCYHRFGYLNRYIVDNRGIFAKSGRLAPMGSNHKPGRDRFPGIPRASFGQVPFCVLRNGPAGYPRVLTFVKWQ